ncbi:hypothetical protein FIBSPDRAFT_684474, partial [Athelia psychrophila]
ARIPSLKTKVDGEDVMVDGNEEKAKILAETFFPPLPTHELFPADTEYPVPLPAPPFLSRERIQQSILKLKPYKAPGPDGIPNVVLKQCADIIIDHLYFIFRAIRELNVYHHRWLVTLTLVLRKGGKPSYDSASAHRPIGLCDTVPKLHATATSDEIIHLAESHNMLPPGQFGG